MCPPPLQDRKEAQLLSAAKAYVAAAAAPRPASMAWGPLRLVGLSEGFQLVLSQLLGVYTEVFSHSPSTLRPVMATAAEHVATALASG